MNNITIVHLRLTALIDFLQKNRVNQGEYAKVYCSPLEIEISHIKRLIEEDLPEDYLIPNKDSGVPTGM